MKTFVRSVTVGVFLLLLGLSTSNAQEVTYQAGPTMTLTTTSNNGGFAWGDVNGDGTLDLFTRANNVLINQITSFSPLTTAGLPAGSDAVSVAFADFNGDGVPDLLEITQGTNIPAIYMDSAGVSFKAATGTGDLANGGPVFNNFCSVEAADYNRDGNLDLAWAGAHGIWLLKGSSGGAFTNAGNGATAGNLAIDTTRNFESWNSNFLDANNDGYPDLLVGGFRDGFARIDTGTAAARKGTILYLNDHNGNFYVPTQATLGYPVYSISGYVGPADTTIDTIYSKVNPGVDSLIDTVITHPYVRTYSTTADTGIIVDDTVRHFESISHTHGDFNNDGIEDLLLLSNGANNDNGNGAYVNCVILYGKGDGTFTYKWNGTSVVAKNGLPQNGAVRSMDAGDYDNDTHLDLLVAGNGVKPWLYKNNGDGTFGPDTLAGVTILGGVVRSIAFVDYDKNGFLDIFGYSGSASAPLYTLQQNLGNSNHWIGFKPIGAGNNMSAIGAYFTVYTQNGTAKQIRTISADAKCEGMGGELWANFGLGTSTSVDSVAVRWPDGQRQTLVLKGGVDRYYTIKEGAPVPAVPVLVAPANNQQNVPYATPLMMKWTKVDSAHGYQLQLGLDPTFTTSLAVNDSTLTDTSMSVSVSPSSTYYWRVLAYNTYLTSGYSATDSFTTVVTAPTEVPTLISPANNATNVSAVVKLVISKTTDASRYAWQVSTDKAFGSFAVNDSTVDTTNTVGPLASGTKYYWHVRGVNPGGQASYTSTDSFTVMTAPPVPVLAFPGHNQKSIRADTLVLKWHSVATDTGYICQISTSSSFSPLVFAADSSKDTTFKAIGLQNLTQYYWRVASYNAGGASAFTALDSFTTIIAIPAVPVLVSPRSTNVARPATFVWNVAARAERYELQVAGISNFSTILVDTTLVDTTIELPKADTLVANTTYYWQVSAIDTGGRSAWSSIAHFKTLTTNVNELGGIPEEYALLQNYPNPFNPSTMIRFDLPKNANVKVVVYDILGRAVATLIDGPLEASRYSVAWSPSNLSSGIYFCRIQAQSQDGSGNFTSVKKLVYMK
jgi:hypothetical protein